MGILEPLSTLTIPKKVMMAAPFETENGSKYKRPDGDGLDSTTAHDKPKPFHTSLDGCVKTFHLKPSIETARAYSLLDFLISDHLEGAVVPIIVRSAFEASGCQDITKLNENLDVERGPATA